MPAITPEALAPDWKIGVEIELLAPKGASRYDLAVAIARQHQGGIRSFFHPQSEPSKVPGAPVFENLTLGFEVTDKHGGLLARCVDDLTLQHDLNRQQAPKDGWYRIVSDDMRFLRLIMHHSKADAPLAEVLEPAAQLFCSELARHPDGMVRLSDDLGASIAIAAPLPGERERPCELITPPIASDHYQRLNKLLTLAQNLQFTAPTEGATHIHFDAARLCSAPVIANLIVLLKKHGNALRQLVGTNPQCTRLGSWPSAVVESVQAPDFIHLPWDDVVARLAPLELSKYCDFNLLNMLQGQEDKHTFEARIFPVWLETESILLAAGLFAAILHWAVDSNAQQGIKAIPEDTAGLLKMLPMNTQLRAYWLSQLAAQH
ncbi:MAG: amidoligase family protein [Thiolinea sp.]